MANDMIQKAAQANVAKKTNKTLKDYVNSMSGEIAKALPSVMTPERFTRMVLSAISVNPKLAECTPQSFLGAMMSAAQLGLEPNTVLGQAFIIPYKNHGVMEASFQLGYKGIIDLAYRSGEVSIVQAHEVHENDTFQYAFGIDPFLKHVPVLKDRGSVIAYYAIFKTHNGGYGFDVMSVDDVLNIAKRSPSFHNGPWQTDFDAMAKKTVLKQTLKYAPLKTDFIRAMSSDNTIKTKIDENMLNVEDETVYADFEVNDATGEVIEGEAKA